MRSRRMASRYQRLPRTMPNSPDAAGRTGSSEASTENVLRNSATSASGVRPLRSRSTRL